MGSLAGPSSPTGAADVVPPDDEAQPPELSEEGYLHEVLHVTAQLSEAQVVDELVAKASALGIATTASRPSTPGKPNISSAESATTDGTRHTRTLSTDSAGSHSTALTAYSFTQGPAKMEAPKAAAKRATKALSFAQYDVYLTQVDPNLKQPKLPKAPPPPGPAPSLFSVSTRKSFVSIRRTLRAKAPWKRRAVVVSIEAPT